MNEINANQMSTVRRKEWCRALNKIPYACVTARDIAMLMNVCKTTSIEIQKQRVESRSVGPGASIKLT